MCSFIPGDEKDIKVSAAVDHSAGMHKFENSLSRLMVIEQRRLNRPSEKFILAQEKHRV